MSSPKQQQQQSLAYREFVDSIKSPASRVLYIQALHYFMDYLRIPRGDYDRLLDKDPKLIQMDIKDFIIFLKNKKLSFATIASYVAAIHKFYIQNDIVTLNWKKIKSFMPVFSPERELYQRPHTDVGACTIGVVAIPDVR